MRFSDEKEEQRYQVVLALEAEGDALREQLAASDKRVRELETALRDLVHWLEDGGEDDMTAVHAARLALSHTKEGKG